jgi:CMP-N,N'-diacetyllegionaminic acid synthase
MQILITICARGGSKGLPRKNILPLNNLPLIAYTIRLAQAFAKEYNADISISTDDKEILLVANSYGLYTKYSRPKELASDEAGKLETILDLINYEEKSKNINYDYFLDLDVSSPLRNFIDLKEAFDLLLANKSAINIFSVSNASKNPYFNMVEKNKDGFAEKVKNGLYLTRQSAPIVYELNASFYFYTRSFFFPQINPVINHKSLIYLVKHICFDIDHKIDYDFMNYLIVHNKLDFNF